MARRGPTEWVDPKRPGMTGHPCRSALTTHISPGPNSLCDRYARGEYLIYETTVRGCISTRCCVRPVWVSGNRVSSWNSFTARFLPGRYHYGVHRNACHVDQCISTSFVFLLWHYLTHRTELACVSNIIIISHCRMPGKTRL